jgi:hypothetical protein
MGFPLPNLVQTGFLPHLNSMDLLPLLARVLISQSKQGTQKGLPTRQVGQARLPAGSIPVHPCNECSRPYAGWPQARNKRATPPQRGMRPGKLLRMTLHFTLRAPLATSVKFGWSSIYSALPLGQKSIGVKSRPYGLAKKKRNGSGDKKSGWDGSLRDKGFDT